MLMSGLGLGLGWGRAEEAVPLPAPLGMTTMADTGVRAAAGAMTMACEVRPPFSYPMGVGCVIW